MAVFETPPANKNHKHWGSHPSWAYMEAGGVGGTYGGAGAGASGILSEYGDYAYPIFLGLVVEAALELMIMMKHLISWNVDVRVVLLSLSMLQCNIVIDGVIDMHGGSADKIGLWGAGGSGGGVLLNTKENFTGSGQILANGAKGYDRDVSGHSRDYWGGAGGGGRVAIHCSLKPLPTSLVLGSEILSAESGAMTPWDSSNVSCTWHCQRTAWLSWKGCFAKESVSMSKSMCHVVMMVTIHLLWLPTAEEMFTQGSL